MRANQGLRPFALLLQREKLTLIDHEHGLVTTAAPLAAPRAQRRNQDWVFDSPASGLPGCRQMFTAADFPLAAYLGWFLERVYPVRKQRLTLVSNLQQALSLSLWQHLFQSLGLREPLRVRSPLQILGAGLGQGVLIYLEDGLAQIGVFENHLASESSQVGYGFYLSRAIRQHVLTRHGLQIDTPTAEAAWQKMGSAGQLTIQGRDAEDRPCRQLLIAEELAPVFAAALEPLLSEIAYLQSRYPGYGLTLLGPQASLPWLVELVCSGWPASFLQPEDPETLLIQSIQKEIKYAF